MSQAPVALSVGGQTYRVRAAVSESELRGLAATVDARLRQLVGSPRTAQPQALLLVAIALAHDLQQERDSRRQLQHEAHQTLQLLLQRLDAAIGTADEALASVITEPANAQD
jgi:cell division protein ZapA